MIRNHTKENIASSARIIRTRLQNKKTTAQLLWKGNCVKPNMLLLCCLFMVTACNDSIFRPVFAPALPNDGPALYQRGFKEGCNTGMTVYGNDIVRAEYHTEVHPELMQNKTYSNAWKLGNRYCRFYVSQMQMEGTIMKDFGTPVYPNSMLPNETELIRERLTDSFWIPQETDGGIMFEGYETPFYQVDNTSGFDGINIGEDGGVFGLFE